MREGVLLLCFQCRIKRTDEHWRAACLDLSYGHSHAFSVGRRCVREWRLNVSGKPGGKPLPHGRGSVTHAAETEPVEPIARVLPRPVETVADSPEGQPLGAAAREHFLRGPSACSRLVGPEAAAEFQKILDHRGIVDPDPIGALAHLQIGRAFALSGDTTKAKTAYLDFLALWKDADRDIPILQKAKAEYAGL
jgi:hypothetical protein